MRVINRVHRHTANGRTNALPALGAGTDGFQLMLFVAHFANGGAAVNVHTADFARAQTQLERKSLRGPAVARKRQRSEPVARPCPAASRCSGWWSHRDVAQRQGVASLDRGFRPDISTAPAFTPFGAMM